MLTGLERVISEVDSVRREMPTSPNPALGTWFLLVVDVETDSTDSTIFGDVFAGFVDLSAVVFIESAVLVLVIVDSFVRFLAGFTFDGGLPLGGAAFRLRCCTRITAVAAERFG